MTYDVDCEDDMPPHGDASDDVSPCEDDVPPEIHDILLETPKPHQAKSLHPSLLEAGKRRGSQSLTLVSKHVFDLCLI